MAIGAAISFCVSKHKHFKSLMGSICLVNTIMFRFHLHPLLIDSHNFTSSRVFRPHIPFPPRLRSYGAFQFFTRPRRPTPWAFFFMYIHCLPSTALHAVRFAEYQAAQVRCALSLQCHSAAVPQSAANYCWALLLSRTAHKTKQGSNNIRVEYRVCGFCVHHAARKIFANGGLNPTLIFFSLCSWTLLSFAAPEAPWRATAAGPRLLGVIAAAVLSAPGNVTAACVSESDAKSSIPGRTTKPFIECEQRCVFSKPIGSMASLTT